MGPAASRPAKLRPLERRARDDRRLLPLANASTAKIGMWVFLATDAMGFGGLLLAQALLRVRASTWPDPALRLDRPLAAGLTLVLLASGATMTAALGAAREGRAAAARQLVLATAALGVVFVLGQATEFRALVVDRHVGLTTDHAAGLFFVLTGYHGLHVLAGVVMLQARRGDFVPPTRPPQTRRGASPPTRPPGADQSRARIRLEGGVSGGQSPPSMISEYAGARAPGEQGRDLVESGVFEEQGALAMISRLEVVALYWQFVEVVWIVIFAVIYLAPGVFRG